MEEMIETKTYELAYHLTTDLEESAVPVQAAELEGLIAQAGGVVLQTRAPKRQHLSYPIRQKRYSHFGTFTFSAAPETIDRLNAQLKLQTPLLRHLLIAQEYEERQRRTLSGERPRLKLKTHEAIPVKEAPAAKPEEMEKKIEEVLEKI